MKMTKKVSDLLLFVEMAGRALTDDVKDTKAGTVLRKQAKVVNTALEGYREKVEDARIEHCSVDEKGNILRDSDRQYVFTKTALKEFTKANKAFLAETVELEVFFKEEHLPIIKEKLDPAFNEYFSEFLELPEE